MLPKPNLALSGSGTGNGNAKKPHFSPKTKIGVTGATGGRQSSKTGGNNDPNSATLKKCHICGRGFHKATYLRRHLQSHSSVKPYKCEICGWGK